MYCNDQEPLNYELYKGHTIETPEIQQLCQEKGIELDKFNFRGEVHTTWDLALLLHSEQRSDQVQKYRDSNFIPVYYWSHAIIARDWFRYAEHCTPNKKVEKTFLIYNRAWSGTREYRLKFSDLLIDSELDKNCLTFINPVEPELGIHYDQHHFLNPTWRPSRMLENYFPPNTTPSFYSADFVFEDYNLTDIEVVLETLFDDDRLHLTEKILRPIACGQPFILVGTQGSLEYLKKYGFNTFGHIWSEQYDQEIDPKKRLDAIISLMKEIAGWDYQTKKQKMLQAQSVADYNRAHFFSNKFMEQCLDELYTNLQAGIKELKNTSTSDQYWRRAKLLNHLLKKQRGFL